MEVCFCGPVGNMPPLVWIMAGRFLALTITNVCNMVFPGPVLIYGCLVRHLDFHCKDSREAERSMFNENLSTGDQFVSVTRWNTFHHIYHKYKGKPCCKFTIKQHSIKCIENLCYEYHICMNEPVKVILWVAFMHVSSYHHQHQIWYNSFDCLITTFW